MNWCKYSKNGKSNLTPSLSSNLKHHGLLQKNRKKTFLQPSPSAQNVSLKDVNSIYNGSNNRKLWINDHDNDTSDEFEESKKDTQFLNTPQKRTSMVTIGQVIDQTDFPKPTKKFSSAKFLRAPSKRSELKPKNLLKIYVGRKSKHSEEMQRKKAYRKNSSREKEKITDTFLTTNSLNFKKCVSNDNTSLKPLTVLNRTSAETPHNRLKMISSKELLQNLAKPAERTKERRLLKSSLIKSKDRNKANDNEKHLRKATAKKKTALEVSSNFSSTTNITEKTPITKNNPLLHVGFVRKQNNTVKKVVFLPRKKSHSTSPHDSQSGSGDYFDANLPKISKVKTVCVETGDASSDYVKQSAEFTSSAVNSRPIVKEAKNTINYLSKKFQKKSKNKPEVYLNKINFKGNVKSSEKSSSTKQLKTRDSFKPEKKLEHVFSNINRTKELKEQKENINNKLITIGSVAEQSVMSKEFRKDLTPSNEKDAQLKKKRFGFKIVNRMKSLYEKQIFHGSFRETNSSQKQETTRKLLGQSKPLPNFKTPRKVYFKLGNTKGAPLNIGSIENFKKMKHPVKSILKDKSTNFEVNATQNRNENPKLQPKENIFHSCTTFTNSTPIIRPIITNNIKNENSRTLMNTGISNVYENNYEQNNTIENCYESILDDSDDAQLTNNTSETSGMSQNWIYSDKSSTDEENLEEGFTESSAPVILVPYPSAEVISKKESSLIKNQNQASVFIGKRKSNHLPTKILFSENQSCSMRKRTKSICLSNEEKKVYKIDDDKPAKSECSGQPINSKKQESVFSNKAACISKPKSAFRKNKDVSRKSCPKLYNTQKVKALSATNQSKKQISRDQKVSTSRDKLNDERSKIKSYTKKTTQNNKTHASDESKSTLINPKTHAGFKKTKEQNRFAKSCLEKKSKRMTKKQNKTLQVRSGATGLNDSCSEKNHYAPSCSSTSSFSEKLCITSSSSNLSSNISSISCNTNSSNSSNSSFQKCLSSVTLNEKILTKPSFSFIRDEENEVPGFPGSVKATAKFLPKNTENNNIKLGKDRSHVKPREAKSKPLVKRSNHIRSMKLLDSKHAQSKNFQKHSSSSSNSINKLDNTKKQKRPKRKSNYSTPATKGKYKEPSNMLKRFLISFKHKKKKNIRLVNFQKKHDGIKNISFNRTKSPSITPHTSSSTDNKRQSSTSFNLLSNQTVCANNSTKTSELFSDKSAVDYKPKTSQQNIKIKKKRKQTKAQSPVSSEDSSKNDSISDGLKAKQLFAHSKETLLFLRGDALLKNRFRKNKLSRNKQEKKNANRHMNSKKPSQTSNCLQLGSTSRSSQNGHSNSFCDNPSLAFAQNSLSDDSSHSHVEHNNEYTSSHHTRAKATIRDANKPLHFNYRDVSSKKPSSSISQCHQFQSFSPFLYERNCLAPLANKIVESAIKSAKVIYSQCYKDSLSYPRNKIKCITNSSHMKIQAENDFNSFLKEEVNELVKEAVADEHASRVIKSAKRKLMIEQYIKSTAPSNNNTEKAKSQTNSSSNTSSKTNSFIKTKIQTANCIPSITNQVTGKTQSINAPSVYDLSSNLVKISKTSKSDVGLHDVIAKNCYLQHQVRKLMRDVIRAVVISESLNLNAHSSKSGALQAYKLSQSEIYKRKQKTVIARRKPYVVSSTKSSTEDDKFSKSETDGSSSSKIQFGVNSSVNNHFSSSEISRSSKDNPSFKSQTSKHYESDNLGLLQTEQKNIKIESSKSKDQTLKQPSTCRPTSSKKCKKINSKVSFPVFKKRPVYSKRLSTQSLKSSSSEAFSNNESATSSKSSKRKGKGISNFKEKKQKKEKKSKNKLSKNTAEPTQKNTKKKQRSLNKTLRPSAGIKKDINSITKKATTVFGKAPKTLLKKFGNIAKRFNSRADGGEAISESSEYCKYEKLNFLFPETKITFVKKHFSSSESDSSYAKSINRIHFHPSENSSVQEYAIPQQDNSKISWMSKFRHEYSKYSRNSSTSNNELAIQNKKVNNLQPSGYYFDKNTSDVNLCFTTSVYSESSNKVYSLLEDEIEASFTNSEITDYEHTFSAKSKNKLESLSKSLVKSHRHRHCTSPYKITIGNKCSNEIKSTKSAKSDALLTTRSDTSSSRECTYKDSAFKPSENLKSDSGSALYSCSSNDSPNKNLKHCSGDEVSTERAKKSKKKSSYKNRLIQNNIREVSNLNFSRHSGLQKNNSNKTFKSSNRLIISTSSDELLGESRKMKKRSGFLKNNDTPQNRNSSPNCHPQPQMNPKQTESSEGARNLLTQLKEDMNDVLNLVQNPKSESFSVKTNPNIPSDVDNNENNEYSLPRMKNLLKDLQSTICEFASEISNKKTIVYKDGSLQNPLNFSAASAFSRDIFKSFGLISEDSQEIQKKAFRRRHYSIHCDNNHKIELSRDRDETASCSSSTVNLSGKCQINQKEKSTKESYKKNTKKDEKDVEEKANKQSCSFSFDCEQNSKPSNSPQPSSRRYKNDQEPIVTPDNQCPEYEKINLVTNSFQDCLETEERSSNFVNNPKDLFSSIPRKDQPSFSEEKNLSFESRPPPSVVKSSVECENTEESMLNLTEVKTKICIGNIFRKKSKQNKSSINKETVTKTKKQTRFGLSLKPVAKKIFGRTKVISLTQRTAQDQTNSRSGSSQRSVPELTEYFEELNQKNETDLQTKLPNLNFYKTNDRSAILKTSKNNSMFSTKKTVAEDNVTPPATNHDQNVTHNLTEESSALTLIEDKSKDIFDYSRENLISITAESSCTISTNSQTIHEQSNDNLMTSGRVMVKIGNQAFTSELQNYLQKNLLANNESPRQHLSSAEYFVSSTLFRPRVGSSDISRPMHSCEPQAVDESNHQCFLKGASIENQQSLSSPYQVSPVITKCLNEGNQRTFKRNAGEPNSQTFQTLTPSAGLNTKSRREKEKSNLEILKSHTKNIGVATSQITVDSPHSELPSRSESHDNSNDESTHSSSNYSRINVPTPAGGDGDKQAQNAELLNDNSNDSLLTSRTPKEYARKFRPVYEPKPERTKITFRSSSSTFSTYDDQINQERKPYKYKRHKPYCKLNQYKRKKSSCACQHYNQNDTIDHKKKQNIPHFCYKTCKCQNICENKNIPIKIPTERKESRDYRKGEPDSFNSSDDSLPEPTSIDQPSPSTKRHSSGGNKKSSVNPNPTDDESPNPSNPNKPSPSKKRSSSRRSKKSSVNPNPTDDESPNPSNPNKPSPSKKRSSSRRSKKSLVNPNPTDDESPNPSNPNKPSKSKKRSSSRRSKKSSVNPNPTDDESPNPSSPYKQSPSKKKSSSGGNKKYSSGGNKRYSSGGNKKYSSGGNKKYSSGGNKKYSINPNPTDDESPKPSSPYKKSLSGGSKKNSSGGNKKYSSGGNKKYSSGGNKKNSSGENKKYSSGGNKKYSSGGNKKYFSWGNKKHSSGENKKYSSGGNKKYSSGGNKKYFSWGNKKYSSGGNKKYSNKENQLSSSNTSESNSSYSFKLKKPNKKTSIWDHPKVYPKRKRNSMKDNSASSQKKRKLSNNGKDSFSNRSRKSSSRRNHKASDRYSSFDEENWLKNDHHKCPYEKYIKALSNIAFLQGFRNHSDIFSSKMNDGKHMNNKEHEARFYQNEGLWFPRYDQHVNDSDEISSQMICENEEVDRCNSKETCQSKWDPKYYKSFQPEISAKSIINASHTLIDTICKIIAVIGIFYLFFREDCDNSYSKRKLALF